MRVAAVSRKGVSRSVNQDSVLAKSWVLRDRSVSVIAVADGMGGHANGDLASATAIAVLSEWLSACGVGGICQDLHAASEGLDSVFLTGHSRISAQNRERGSDSGTTLTVCYCCDNRYLVKNTGDSRCYVVENSTLRLLSIDDSWDPLQTVSDSPLERRSSLASPRSNLLTRCLGLGKYAPPHSNQGTLKDGDVVMVCTDGFDAKLDSKELLCAAVAWRDHNENPISRLLPVLMERQVTDDITIALLT